MHALPIRLSRADPCSHNSLLYTRFPSGPSSLPPIDILNRRRALGNESFANALKASAVSIQSNRVFIVNLPWQTTLDDLTGLMAKVGRLVYAEVLVDALGRSKGCGIAEYEDTASAERAISQLSMQVFFGRQIFVKPDHFANASYGHEGVKLFVGNVPRNLRWQQLRELFRDYGPVSDAVIAPNKDGELWGSVTVLDPRAAALAVMELHGFVAGLDGSKLVVSTWDERDPRIEDDVGLVSRPLSPAQIGGNQSQIIVFNLPDETDNTDLMRLFEFGGVAVRRAEVLRRDGRTKGIGIVEFTDSSAAQWAVEKLHGYEYGNRILRLRMVRDPFLFSASASTPSIRHTE